MTEENNRLIVPYLIYLLPSLHLVACVAMWLSEYRNLEPMILIDFPFSFLAVAAAYQGVNPWIILGIVGTLWWYFISRFIRWIVIGTTTGSWKSKRMFAPASSLVVDEISRLNSSTGGLSNSQ